MTERKRPTSPHLQIYKWNVSSLTSIMNRATGVLLFLSVLAISWYIVYYTYQINIAESEDTCACAWKAIFDKVFALAALAVTFSLYFHFINGIRHLFWDIGYGFDKRQAKINGYLVLALSALLTVATIGTALYFKFF